MVTCNFFTQAEAVVNAGPAVFISTSGPNPIMVQVNIHCFMIKYLIVLYHYFFHQVIIVSAASSISAGNKFWCNSHGNSWPWH